MLICRLPSFVMNNIGIGRQEEFHIEIHGLRLLRNRGGKGGRREGGGRGGGRDGTEAESQAGAKRERLGLKALPSGPLQMRPNKRHVPFSFRFSFQFRFRIMFKSKK
jgi:hypothetical protein